jgi:hypothetical protein
MRKPQTPTVNSDYKLTFGKHVGKTIGKVLNESPDYIIWLSKNNLLYFSDDIIEIAERLEDKTDDYMMCSEVDLY